MSEGNIISFKVFVDSKGLIMTEYSKLPAGVLSKIFSTEDLFYIEKILTMVDPKFKDLHTDLEQELAALN